jgi:hypothetical protein
MILGILQRSGLLARLRGAWKADIDSVAKPVRKDLRQLTQRMETAERALDQSGAAPVGKDVRLLLKRLEAVERELEQTREMARSSDRLVTQLKLTTTLNERQRRLIAELPRVLDERRVTEHVRDAIAAAPLLTDPYEHIVVERLLPDDVYDLILEAIPPIAFFSHQDPIKRNIRFPLGFGPELSTRVWDFFDNTIARGAIRTTVLEKFDGPLQRHFDSIFGPEFRARANDLRQSVSGGRLMLRAPGYHLGPHRDPKRSMLTCLLYLARPDDSEVYGTQIFRVADDSDATYKQTYYPEQDGHACELVKVVPFRANTMLAFLNSRGAHGATIPADAPSDLQRYAYQFYIAPENDDLAALIEALPPARQALWQEKGALPSDARILLSSPGGARL